MITPYYLIRGLKKTCWGLLQVLQCYAPINVNPVGGGECGQGVGI